MPRIPRIYAGNASLEDLKKLCQERNLPTQNSIGNSLTRPQLKEQLDEFQQNQEAASAPVTAPSDAVVEAQVEPKQTADEAPTAVVTTAVTPSPNAESVFIPQSQATDLARNAGQTQQGRSHSASALDLFTIETLPQSESFTSTEAPEPQDDGQAPEKDHYAGELTAKISSSPESTANAGEDAPTQVGLHGFITGESPDPIESPLDQVPAAIPPGPYFLQFEYDKLSTYLRRGVIVPAALDPEPGLQQKRAPDILTKHPNFLPLTLGRLPSFSDQDVLVELTLRPEELVQIVPVGSIYGFAAPLPVSRIRRVLFADADSYAEFELSAKSDKNIFLSQAQVAYLNAPETRVLVVAAPVEKATDAPTPTYASDWPEHLQQFDQQLGLFGYLKHAPLLEANAAQVVQDYPAEMLFALNLLNSAIAPAKPARGSDVAFRTLLRLDSPLPPQTAGQLLLANLSDDIYAGVEASFDWATNLLDKVIKESQTASDAFTDLSYLHATRTQIDLMSRTGINFQHALAAISGDGPRTFPKAPFAAIVLLCKYPNRARGNTDKQAVLETLGKAADRRALDSSSLEWLLAIFGLYYAYSRLTREDPNLVIQDPQLAALARPLHRLRFNTDSFADCAIIETVFRFATEGQPLNDPLNYLRPGATDNSITMPLRRGALPATQTLFGNTTHKSLPSLPSAGKGQQPSTTESLNDLQHYRNALSKMMRWFTPEHFQQQLLPTFTPAEQALLRDLLAPKK